MATQKSSFQRVRYDTAVLCTTIRKWDCAPYSANSSPFESERQVGSFQAGEPHSFCYGSISPVSPGWLSVCLSVSPLLGMTLEHHLSADILRGGNHFRPGAPSTSFRKNGLNALSVLPLPLDVVHWTVAGTGRYLANTMTVLRHHIYVPLCTCHVHDPCMT